jgi:hypothetical protein
MEIESRGIRRALHLASMTKKKNAYKVWRETEGKDLPYILRPESSLEIKRIFNKFDLWT